MLYKPDLEDLWFRQKMLADPQTMSYNHAWGGTIEFPEKEWSDWYDHWIVNCGRQRFYRYLMDEAGAFIGETACHYDEERAIYLADVIVYATFRGRGYGGKALELLCDAAKKGGVDVLYDDIAIDNPAASLFLKHGFTEEYRTSDIITLKRELK